MKGLISGILLMAIGASAKAIVDVQVMKESYKSLREIVLEIKDDVKYIKRRQDEKRTK